VFFSANNIYNQTNFPDLEVITPQLRRAVGHIHRRGIAHRDLKPENVTVQIIRTGPAIKLVDFGLAVFVEDTPLCEKLCGSVPFVAPEVARGERYCPLRADLWSLGMVLFECYAGLHSPDRLFNWTSETAPNEALANDLQSFFEQHDEAHGPGCTESVFVCAIAWNERGPNRLRENEAEELKSLLQFIPNRRRMLAASYRYRLTYGEETFCTPELSV